MPAPPYLPRSLLEALWGGARIFHPWGMAAWRTGRKETASQFSPQNEALSRWPHPGDAVRSLKSPGACAVLGQALTQSEKDSEKMTWAFCDIH